MNYILLAVSIFVALVSGIFSKYYIDTYNKGQHANHIFNTITSLFSVIVLALWNGAFEISLFTLVLSLVFGLTTAIQRIFSMKAMQTGPWSYTAVISSLSTIIPTLSGCIIWNESINVVQIIGIALMLICMCLASDLKKDTSKKSVKWMTYCAVLFVATGMIGVMQKWHQSTVYKDELGEFLVISLAISCIFTAICAFNTRNEESAKENRKKVFTFIPLFIMLFVGIAVAINNQLNLYLSGVLDSSLMFPIVNGGGLMLTTLSATLIFKERLSKKQWFGLIIGAVAVILLCNPF